MATASLEQHAPVTGLRWWREVGWRHVVGVVMIVICVLPLLYVISASLNPNGTLTGSNKMFRVFSTANYTELAGTDFAKWGVNSLVICTVTALGTVFMGAAAATREAEPRERVRRGCAHED